MPNNVSFDNASSLAPKIGFEPDGFLGGMWAGQRNNDYRQAVEQSNLMKALAAKEQMDKLQEYNTNAPVRDAERLSKIAGFDASAATIGDKLGGEAASGRVLMGTAPSKIAEQNATSGGKIDDAMLAKFGKAAKVMAEYGPMLTDENTPVFQRMAIHDKLKQQFPGMLPEQFDPNAFKQNMEMSRSILKQIGERENAGPMALQGLKNSGDIEQAKTTGGFSVQVANIHAAATRAAAQASAGTDKIKTFENAILQLERAKYSNPEEWSKNPNNDKLLQEIKGQQAREKIYATLPAILNSNIMAGKGTDVPALLKGMQTIVDQASGKEEAKTPNSKENPLSIKTEGEASKLPKGTWIELNGRRGQVE